MNSPLRIPNSELKTRFLAGIFFISAATLCLEISLIRYFSISQQYHFAFWVVSVAFLGYGASGSFMALSKNLLRIDHNKFLSTSSFLFSLSLFLSFLICNAISFDFIKLSWERNHIFLILLFYFLLSLPFFFAGLTISFAITRAANIINKVYFSDLFGAGIGTLLTIFVFLPFGDRGVILSISFLALTASFLFSFKRPPLFKLILILIMSTNVFLYFYSPSWLSFRISPFKALPLALRYPEAKHLFTRWNAISRVDILESPAARFAPGLSLLYDKELPSQLGLSIDGDELTAITQFKNSQDPSLDFLSALPSSLAYSFLQEPRVLIIEPKGGIDVLSAIIHKASQIKIIESNPLITKILRKELSSFSGNIYLKKNIHVISSHSRAALKKEKENHDLIVFSLSDVFGAASTGLYGFGEKYLYTVDSFIDILSNLSPEGMVSMSLYLLPPPRQEIRVLATWIEALEKSEKKAASHIIAIRSWGTISYFIKKRPFTVVEIQKLKDHSEKFLFDLVYYPGIKLEEANIHNKFETPLYHNMTLQVLSSRERREFYEDYLFDVTPVSDNRPFFFNFFKMSKIKSTYQALRQKWLPFLQGEFLVPLLLLQSIIIAFVLILLPLLGLRRERSRRKDNYLKVFLYFSFIGMAFMFVEITFIQKFILFLGHPLYSASVIIFSLLLASGLGSFFSKNILGHKMKKNLKLCLSMNATLILITLLSFPFLYRNFIGSSLLIKIFLTFLFVFPLGFFMGFPFPTGIRLLEPAEKRMIPWAWATNAFSSVINSILALMIAFWGGYSLVLILAAGGYLLALPFLGFSSHRNKHHI